MLGAQVRPSLPFLNLWYPLTPHQLPQMDHDPGRPPWTQPWEVAVLTLGAVGFAVMTGFSAYFCSKRIVQPLLLQRVWARCKQQVCYRPMLCTCYSASICVKPELFGRCACSMCRPDEDMYSDTQLCCCDCNMPASCLHQLQTACTGFAT